MPRYTRSRKPFYLGRLPPELFLMISSHLNAKDHANLCMVSKGVRSVFVKSLFESIRLADYPQHLIKVLDAFKSCTEDSKLDDARIYILHATIAVHEAHKPSQPLEWSNVRDFPNKGPVVESILPKAIATAIECMANLQSLSLNLRGLSRLQEDQFRHALYSTAKWNIRYLRITDLGRKNIVGSLLERCTPDSLEGLDIAENCYTDRAIKTATQHQSNIKRLMFRRFVRPGSLTYCIIDPNQVSQLVDAFRKLEWLGLITEMKGSSSGIRRRIGPVEIISRTNRLISVLKKAENLKRLVFCLPEESLSPMTYNATMPQIPDLQIGPPGWNNIIERLAAGIIQRISSKLPLIQEIYVFHYFPHLTMGRREDEGSPMITKSDRDRRTTEKPNSQFPFGIIG